MIHACLFDIGNVLVSFDYSRTFPRLAPHTGRSLEELKAHLAQASVALETGRLSSEAFMDEAVGFLGDGVTHGAFREAFTGIFDLIEPVWSAVQTVRSAVPVHLFSNTSELHETWLFEAWPQFRDFDGGFFSWRMGCMKPDDAFYNHALEVLQLPPEQIAYVDDLPANIETGRRMGFHCHQYDFRNHGALLEFLTGCGLPVPAA